MGAPLTIAYVPFCGVVSPRYAPSLVRLGMDQTTAEQVSAKPIYRRQNVELAEGVDSLHLPLADTSKALVEAERAGTAQYWDFDTHPPAGGLRHHRKADRARVPERPSVDPQEPPCGHSGQGHQNSGEVPGGPDQHIDCATWSDRARDETPDRASFMLCLCISRQAYKGASPQPTMPPAMSAKINPQCIRSRPSATAETSTRSISS